MAAAPHWPGLTPTYVELALNWPTIKWTDSTLGLSCIFILLAVKVSQFIWKYIAIAIAQLILSLSFTEVTTIESMEDK